MCRVSFLFCRGDQWSPADACGNGKPSGRIWNPPLRRRGRRPRRPGRAAAAARPAGGQWPPLQSPLGPLCEGAPPAGGGGENCTAARNISGYGKVLSLRPFGAPPSQREVRLSKKCIVGATIGRPRTPAAMASFPGGYGIRPYAVGVDARHRPGRAAAAAGPAGGQWPPLQSEALFRVVM